MKKVTVLFILMIIVLISSVFFIENVVYQIVEFADNEKISDQSITNKANTNFTNLSHQKDLEKQINEEYNSFNNKYTYDNPYIKVNPYGINPLSSYIIFDNKVPVKYSYTVVGKTKETDFSYSNKNYNTHIVIPIVGLYSDQINTINYTIITKDNQKLENTIKIKTTKANYNKVKIKKYNQDEVTKVLNQGFIFDALYNGFDQNEDIRFNFNVGSEDNYIKMQNGYILAKVDDYQTLYELDMMGRIHHVYKTPSAKYNFHHDAVITKDGTIFALGSYNVDLKNIPYAETFVFKYTKSGKPIKIIDLKESYDKNLVSYYGTPNENDFVHFNSIEYLEEYNELILSSQAQSSISAINADTGKVDLIVADNKATKQNVEKLLTIKNKEKFEYPSGQHSVFLTKNKKYEEARKNGELTFAIFNNNNCKDDNGQLQFKKYSKKPNPNICTYDKQSDILIYGINPKEKTVTQLDKFVVDGEYSAIMGSVFDSNDDTYNIHFSHKNDSTNYIIDNNGKLIMKTIFKYNSNGSGYYRSNIFSGDEINGSLNNLEEEVK